MSNISCREFEGRLEEAVESRCALEPVLKAHASVCAACGALYDDYIRLEEAIPAWRAAVPAVDLAEAVLARWAFDARESQSVLQPLISMRPTASPVRKPAAWRNRIVWIAGAAALLILTTIIATPLRERGGNRPVADAPIQDYAIPVASTTDEALPSDPELSVLVRDAGSAYLDLANQAATAISGGTALLPSATLLADATPQSTSANRSWVGEFEKKLEPLSKDLGDALNFLLKAPPPEPAPST